jgi:hypothetical protein
MARERIQLSSDAPQVELAQQRSELDALLRDARASRVKRARSLLERVRQRRATTTPTWAIATHGTARRRSSLDLS